MSKHWRNWWFLAVIALVLAGCSTFQGLAFKSKNNSPAAKSPDPSPVMEQKAVSLSASSLKREEPPRPSGVTSESKTEPKNDLYQQVTEPADQLYDEGLSALMEENPSRARDKFKEALTLIKAAQEKYPQEKERLEQFYLTLKKDIEAAQKDALMLAEDKRDAGGEGTARAESVLMVKPEELEKLGPGNQPLEKPRQINSDLPVVFNEPVERFIRAFQTVRRGKFYEGMGRMGRYQPYIQKIFKEKGIPQDLIYLGLIESAFNPHVLSRARALGIWQFIPGTGRVYRLRQDFWVDERKDFEKATEAAATYLKNLYDRFGDWALALAGYNAGEGRVEWALRRSKGRDYWQLRLPRETKLYVPAIYASVVIAKNLEEYGFKDLRLDSPFEYEKVSVPDATDLKIIADCAGVDPQLVRDMNPELLRWCTPPQVNYEVKIPVGTKAKFEEKFAQIPKDQWVSWRTHKVRSGETLGKIGKQYRIPPATLAQMNHLKSIHRISVGQVLMIPVPWGAPLPHQQPAPSAVATPPSPPQQVKTEPTAAPEPIKAEAKAQGTPKEIKQD